MKDLLKTKSFKQKIKDFFRSQDNRHIFACGENNQFLAVAPKRAKKIRLRIYGNNNAVIVKTKERFLADIRIGVKNCPVNNCKIIIEEGCTAEGVEIAMMENDLSLSFGKDCMLAGDIKIFCSDIHTIYDKNNEVVNRGKDLIIGNHVWVGSGVNIAKKSYIADNCIVGMKSVIAGKYEETNCVIAGNPARVVKHDVNWDRLSIPSFELKNKD
jgi:acetyltransferase-like isoleucine patch superfamily enzyme